MSTLSRTVSRPKRTHTPRASTRGGACADSLEDGGDMAQRYRLAPFEARIGNLAEAANRAGATPSRPIDRSACPLSRHFDRSADRRVAEKSFTRGARSGAPYRKDFSARFASVEMTGGGDTARPKRRAGAAADGIRGPPLLPG